MLATFGAGARRPIAPRSSSDPGASTKLASAPAARAASTPRPAARARRGPAPRRAGRLHPPDALVQALDRQGVGAGDEEEVAVAPRLDRRPDLLHIVVATDPPLAPHVAAPLRPDLVLQEAAGGPGGDQLGDGAVDVQRIAVAGVVLPHSR